MSKLELTAGQRARVREARVTWGEDYTLGLAEMFDDMAQQMSDTEAARMTDYELARRLAWVRKARRISADEFLKVTDAEVRAVLAEMVA